MVTDAAALYRGHDAGLDRRQVGPGARTSIYAAPSDRQDELRRVVLAPLAGAADVGRRGDRGSVEAVNVPLALDHHDALGAPKLREAIEHAARPVEVPHLAAMLVGTPSAKVLWLTTLLDV